jgi:hypothetical protein
VITSKQILSLSEDYSKSVKVFDKQVDIYKDPTSSDLTALNKSARENQYIKDQLRFIADAKDKSVYVWNAELAIHNEVRKTLGFPLENNWTPWLVDGLGKIAGGRLQMYIWDKFEIHLDEVNKKSKKDILRTWFEKTFAYNWSFADRYVSSFSVKMTYYENEYQKVKK